MEKLKNVLIYVLLTVFGLALARHFVEMPVIAIVFIALIVFVAYKCDIPKFGFWLFLFSFIIRIIVVILFDTPITDDYAVQFKAAKEIISGNFNIASTIASGYMLRWGYQMGYTLFMVLLMFINESVVFIKGVNCLFTSFVVLFVYLISSELTNKKTARIISVLYALFPFPLFFNTIVSNQHISSFLFLLAIYILIGKKTESMNYKLKYFLIGLCLALGNIIRPEAIIFMFSILAFLLLTMKKNSLKQIMKAGLILSVTYLSITISASTIVAKTGISPSGFENKVPLWKIAVGFNQLHKGDYSRSLAATFPTDKNAQLQIVYDYTIGSIEKIPALFMYKEQHFWLDNELNWSLNYLKDKSIYLFGIRIPFNYIRSALDSINQLYLYIFFALGLMAIIINRKKMDDRQYLLLIVILTYSLVYLLIECTPRYAYTAQIFLVLMSSYSVKYILDYFQKKKSKKKKTKKVKISNKSK